MNALFKYRVIHKRLYPKLYTFVHNLFWFKLDLDNLSAISSRLFSHNHFNLYSFYDKDHLKIGKRAARDNYISFARQNGFDSEVTSVVLYTNVRFLGYVFNPISIYKR